MAYIGLRRTESVHYKGKTDGYGEALVKVADVSRDSQGHARISYHNEWQRVECRNVPYSGSEEVEITIHVADDAFNSKVRETAGSVNLVSGTVGLFQSEQVQQVTRNAIEIAKSLKNGFNAVVASEISQQIGAMEERSKNSYQLLQTYKKHMDEIFRTMERDYNNIKSRNVKQFDSINKQYTDMIHNLDSASFAMSKELAASMASYAELSVAIQNLLPEESSRTRNNLETTQLNSTSGEIIDEIAMLLRQYNAYNDFIRDKISGIGGEAEEMQCLPVLFFENDALKGDYIDSKCFMHLEDDGVKKAIEESVKNALHHQKIAIENDYQENLQKRINQANLDSREKDISKSLVQENKN